MDDVTDFYMERNQSPKPPLGSVLPPVSDILTPRTLGQDSRWCCLAWRQNTTQTEMFVGQSALTEFLTSYSSLRLKLNLCAPVGAAAHEKDLEKCDVCAVRFCAASAVFCIKLHPF